MAQKKKSPSTEPDSAYFLKLVLYIVVSTFWIKFSAPIDLGLVTLSAFPIGLFIGLAFASHDHFAIDRKIEYAVLIIMTVIAYFLPAGILL